jgi:UDP-N-acetylglucosamine 2-epimerase (non-hydrolysing)
MDSRIGPKPKSTPVRVLIILGTRPEAIKLAPVIRELKAGSAFDVRMALTGQHREMVDEILGPLGMRSDVDLDVMSPGQTLNQLVSRIVPRMDDLLAVESPDVVLVQGDTTSAFCATLAAFHRRIRVGHVEAGLRSYDRFHPYPEEANRRMVSACADFHFAPTERAAKALLAEGIAAESVYVTGNTVIDALMLALSHGDAPRPLTPEPRVLVTLHRREAWDATDESGVSVMDGILTGVRGAAERNTDYEFVYPVHKNPRVRDSVARVLGGTKNVRLVEPIPYFEFVRTMAGSSLILTDSGGIQEESPSLGVPVIVLRKTTERPEALGVGANVLAGIEPGRITSEICSALKRRRQTAGEYPCPSPYGDGKASARIAQALLHELRAAPRPVPFSHPETRS